MPNNAPKGPAPTYTEEQLAAMQPHERKKVKAAQAKRLRRSERSRVKKDNA